MEEKILFLGNSITRHGLASYWWGDWGMAASRRSSDYAHLLVEGMEQKGCSVSFEAFNFYAWEGMEHDRAEALQLIEPKLSADKTLIVCQLGENIQSPQGFYEDYLELLEFIHSHVPTARIMAISPFWPLPEISAAEKRAAESCGVSFIDCSDLWGRQEWMCPDGYKVEGENGELHPVEHQGVRRHPSDRGHAEIARRLLRVWEQLPVAGNVGNVADYQEVKPDLCRQTPLFKKVGRDDIVKIIDGFKAYREQAVAAGRFDMKAFRQEMDKVFDECGYRQHGQGKQTEILVITDSGVGDFINLSPCLREIRRIYIGAKITLVSYSRARALAEACPYIDELYLNSRSFKWGDFLAAYDWNISYATRLLRHRFEVAFVFGHYPSSYLLAYMSGARDRVSYGKDNCICSGHPYAVNYPVMVPLLTVPLPYMVQSDNCVDVYLGILDNFLHAPVQNRNIEIWGQPAESAELVEIINRKFGQEDESAEYIAVGVGGTAVRKHWPPEYYAALLKMLLQENRDRRFVIIGGPEDQSEAQAIVRLVGSKYAGEFTTELNFRMSAAAIGRCSCYIGNDTSSMHLAAAHGVPVLNPNCYPVSLGLGERAVPVVFAPRNIPVVMALPKEALPECRDSHDEYGCKMHNKVHCIAQVKPELMLQGFHMLQDMKRNGIVAVKYIVAK